MGDVALVFDERLIEHAFWNRRRILPRSGNIKSPMTVLGGDALWEVTDHKFRHAVHALVLGAKKLPEIEIKGPSDMGLNAFHALTVRCSQCSA